jgi:hypothetical protein
MTERPNTVSGLVAKRKELIAFRNGLESELRKVICDIDHLDAAISLFDASTTPRAVQRYATKHRAKKGHLKRFVLDRLREASGPITSREVTEAWIAARGLKADEATFVILRKRTGAVLTKLKAEGTIVGVALDGDYKGYVAS